MRVSPRASRTAIVAVIGDGAQTALKIALQAPPIDGRANAALIEFLAEILGVPRSSIEIASGERGRNKTLLVRARRAAEVATLIDKALPGN